MCSPYVLLKLHQKSPPKRAVSVVVVQKACKGRHPLNKKLKMHTKILIIIFPMFYVLLTTWGESCQSTTSLVNGLHKLPLLFSSSSTAI